MTPVRFSRIAAIALPLVLTSHLAWGQSYGASPYGQSPYAPPYVQQSLTPDADALADQMRALAANPSDVAAMVRAGELTLKLDDPTAAAGFFARAERIDPSNPRIKAGKGTLLVMAGRPGEALQRFAEAEQLRGDVRQFAADRGLAYDLIGEQERAQRDYRLALREGPADETLRRYALSLGISGRRDEALQTIDGLLRRSDRGAWRARAFILAMTGDAPGAERIAASMMPGGMGQGLQPFFDRLPQLGAADRAFAVHFGEVRTTPQRLADARLIPRLPALAPEPGRQMAAVQVASVAQPARDDRQNRRDRRKRGRDRIDLVTVAPPVPLPQPPAYQPPVVATSYAQVYAPTTVAPRTPTGLPPVTLASNRVVPSAVPFARPDIAPIVRSPTPTTALTPVPVSVVPVNEAAIRSVAPTPRAAEVATARPVVVEAKPVPAPVQLASATLPPVATPAAAAVVTPPVTVAAAPSAAVLPPAPGPAADSFLAKIVANITVPGSELTDTPVEPAAVATIAADDAQASLIAEQRAADRIANAKAQADAQAAAERRAAAEVATRVEPSIVRRRGETTRQFEARQQAAAAVEAAPVLVQHRGESAKAFAARKLAAAATSAETPLVRRRGETAKAFEARKLAAAGPSEADTPVLTRKRSETAAAFEARKRAATGASEDDAPLVRRRGETAKQFAARQAASEEAPALVRKPGESARAFAARKLAAGAPGKAPAKPAEPARIWVQVAGGANEGDLDKAWDKVRKDAPVAMRGRTGWMTPWKATNRVLAGPFKSDAEARGFVNALGKEGVSAFSFTSEAGQKVTRLAGK